MGAMGAGIALKIKNKYPIVFKKYKAMCAQNRFNLGQIQLVRVSDSLIVCNLAGQHRYGRDRCYTDYDAVRTALKKLNYHSQQFNQMVFIPYKMGCSLAGGDWNLVSNIIFEEISHAIICNYA
jgi:hypothetical protein